MIVNHTIEEFHLDENAPDLDFEESLEKNHSTSISNEEDSTTSTPSKPSLSV